jgi:hypothetical protein
MANYTTIDNPELYFQCKNYVGSSSAQSITLDGSEDMQPDFIWFKNRETASRHQKYDSARGATKLLNSDEPDGEQTVSYFTSFDSDGFTIPSGSSALNGGSQNIIAWCWKESTTAGFDMVTYTGDASTDRSISHGLSVAPKTMIIKNRSGSHAWMVYHDVLGSNSGTTRRFLQLDNGNGYNNGGTGDFPAPPTSSVFKVGNFDTMNKSGDSIIAYCFHEVRGFSKFGLYVGNGSTDGAQVFCGFRPSWLMTKEYKNGTGHWRVRDNKRSPHNPVGIVLRPDTNVADVTEDNVDFLSNGFKIRTSGGENNGSGDVYAFWAFAEAPFVNSKGVPCNAR